MPCAIADDAPIDTVCLSPLSNFCKSGLANHESQRGHGWHASQFTPSYDISASLVPVPWPPGQTCIELTSRLEKRSGSKHLQAPRQGPEEDRRRFFSGLASGLEVLRIFITPSESVASQVLKRPISEDSACMLQARRVQRGMDSTDRKAALK